jgi:hypothetical protein
VALSSDLAVMSWAMKIVVGMMYREESLSALTWYRRLLRFALPLRVRVFVVECRFDCDEYVKGLLGLQ